MSERRMFAKAIIDSDAFLDMPVTARLLYYDLAMRADDDGFVNAPKKIMRFIGASEDDIRILALRKFIIPFDNGVVVIKHWRIHNYIRKDMYHETKYKDQLSQLELDENNAYRLADTDLLQVCNEPVTNPSTQVRLGKDSIGKVSIGEDRIGKDSINKKKVVRSTTKEKVPTTKRFIPPTVEEVQAYCDERNNGIDAEAFIAFYESKGWMVGSNKMTSWKGAIVTWEKRNKATKATKKTEVDAWMEAARMMPDE